MTVNRGYGFSGYIRTEEHFPVCGIAGIALRSLENIDPEFASVQVHRGPDDQGMILSDGVTVSFHRKIEIKPKQARLALIHHRLSIIDLSELGRQPMSTPDGRYYLAYNGEIYNYIELRAELLGYGVKFRSESDTEVVLQALSFWGKEALKRFEGMFALALWDTSTRTVLLARDFFGIKPLHYHKTEQRFAFASEMKALLKLDGVEKNLDAQATFEFLRYGQTDNNDSTLLRDVRQLEAGCWMEVHIDRPGSPKNGRFWQPQSTPVDLSFDDAAAHVRELFLRNVSRHLRSDVQVGAALSGGIDSSAIVCAIRHLQPEIDLHTFSYIAGDGGVSEEPWVDIVAKQCQTTVHKIGITAKDLVLNLDELIEAQDQPFSSTSILAQFCVFRSAREAGVKVMLDGQGADEMFGGYSNFLGARLASLLSRGRLNAAIKFLLTVGEEIGYWRLLQTAGPFMLPNQLEAWLRKLVGRDLIPKWLDSDWFRAQGVSLGPIIQRPITKTMYSDELIRSTTDALPHLLRYEDRNSMHFSIESRVPFLTPELVNFAISVPEEHSLTPDGTRKALFRQAMRGIVPDQILDRRDKVGFETPERAWLLQLEPWVRAVIAEYREVKGPCPIDLHSLTNEWESFRAGQKRFNNHLWRCLNLIVWAKRHGIAINTV